MSFKFPDFITHLATRNYHDCNSTLLLAKELKALGLYGFSEYIRLVHCDCPGLTLTLTPFLENRASLARTAELYRGTQSACAINDKWQKWYKLVLEDLALLSSVQ